MGCEYLPIAKTEATVNPGFYSTGVYNIFTRGGCYIIHTCWPIMVARNAA